MDYSDANNLPEFNSQEKELPTFANHGNKDSYQKSSYMERYSMEEEQDLPEHLSRGPGDDQIDLEQPDMEEQSNVTGWLNKASFVSRDTFNAIDFNDKSMVDDRVNTGQLTLPEQEAFLSDTTLAT